VKAGEKLEEKTMLKFTRKANGNYESEIRHPFRPNLPKYILEQAEIGTKGPNGEWLWERIQSWNIYLAGTVECLEEGCAPSLIMAMEACQTIEEGGNPFYHPENPDTANYEPNWRGMTFN
jgi:hypothetical protein